MSNQNEWETVITDNLSQIDRAIDMTCVTADVHYEYRLQRRKKEKVMPEPREGMGVWFKFETAGGNGVIMRVCGDVIIANKNNGEEYMFNKDKILSLYCRGAEIWRRGES